MKGIKNIQESVCVINNNLKDDLSKYIFMNRVMFSTTGDYSYIKNIVLTTDTGRKVYDKMKNCCSSIGIFGAGLIGSKIYRMFSDIRYDCFVDNRKKGEHEGLPILSLKEFLDKNSNGTLLIAMRTEYDSIKKQLKRCGVSDRRIINYGFDHVHMSDNKQYFDLEQLWTIRYDKEVFVDGGAFDGNNTKSFHENILDKQGKKGFSYVCEPEANKISVIKNNLREYKQECKIIPSGLWDKKELLSFKEDNTASRIDKKGTEVIEVDYIDNFVDGPVSYIKMDIEGAELRAVSGAKRTICTYLPRLAICVYHKDEDIIEIPEYILKLGDYDLYLRHYSLTDAETVLYAIPARKQ